jgi:hypothetical protein
MPKLHACCELDNSEVGSKKIHLCFGLSNDHQELGVIILPCCTLYSKFCTVYSSCKAEVTGVVNALFNYLQRNTLNSVALSE